MSIRRLCGCGCGKPVRLAKHRYLHGHNGRGAGNGRWRGGRYVDVAGYVRVLQPDHLSADMKGYVHEHVFVAVEALRQPLPSGAEVHHVNGVKHDNRPENLVICEDRAYHFLLHVRTAALDACGHADWRKCTYCGEYDDPQDEGMYDPGERRAVAYHYNCRNAQRRAA